MDGFVLTDAQWARMAPHGMGGPEDQGRTGGDNRLFVEAVLWIVRNGKGWPALPAEYGKWHSVYVRFRNWKKADVFKRMFNAVADDPTMEYAMPDDRIIHLPSQGQKRAKGLPARREPPRIRKLTPYW